MIELSEQQIIDEVVGKLSGLHCGVEPERVFRIVHAEYARFDGRPIRAFVPLFVERNANAELVKLSG
jgi:hypothetical protein